MSIFEESGILQYIFIYVLPLIFLIVSFSIVIYIFMTNKTFRIKLNVLSHVIYFNVFYTLIICGIDLVSKNNYDILNFKHFTRGKVYLYIGMIGYLYQISILIYKGKQKMNDDNG